MPNELEKFENELLFNTELKEPFPVGSFPSKELPSSRKKTIQDLIRLRRKIECVVKAPHSNFDAQDLEALDNALVDLVI